MDKPDFKNSIKAEDLRGYVLPRFLAYTMYWTTSSRHTKDVPSTPGQWELARHLEKELRELGIADVALTGHCYVIAKIPASPGLEAVPALGFMAHIDTSEDVSGRDVNPILVEEYGGGVIELADGLSLDPAKDPCLAAQKGRPIVHTDGSTLLGADDKAGLAIITGAASYLLSHPEIKHGPLEIIFTPDEETGKGLPCFPLDQIKATACFTVDGGPLGELEVECFNAYRAEVKFTGRVIHLGAARGQLANAALMAACFAAMLPRSESPEATDGYYGYYCPTEISGNLESAALEVFIRDFDGDRALERVDALRTFARAVEAQFPGGKVSVEAGLQYCNMKEKILAHGGVLELLEQAAKSLGLDFTPVPIRGGTDGSRLTEMGIPTPNIFTGGRNFHSRAEWVSVTDMLVSSRLVIELICLWASKN